LGWAEYKIGAIVCQYKVCRKIWAGTSTQKMCGVIKNLAARRAFLRFPQPQALQYVFYCLGLVYKAEETFMHL